MVPSKLLPALTLENSRAATGGEERKGKGLAPTCRIVKFSKTLFIIYFSGRCFSLWIKLIMYSHMGERWMRYTKRPFSSRAYSVWGQRTHGACWFLSLPPSLHTLLPCPPAWLTSTFSTTCLPKEQTLVETLMVILSAELYWELTP